MQHAPDNVDLIPNLMSSEDQLNRWVLTDVRMFARICTAVMNEIPAKIGNVTVRLTM